MANYTSSNARWAAIQSRDPRAEGQFFYAVKSTGVYCRPTCPSRRPKRENVSFFHNPASAEQHGYRPCKRCRPDSLRREIEMVKRICAIIDASCGEKLTLTRLSQQAHLSPYHLQKTFKRVLGLSPRQYQEHKRLEQFKTHLRRGENVARAAHEAGFSSEARVYERAARQMGMKPADYRRRGRDQLILYTIANTPLGKLLLAATSGGVCRIDFGDSRQALETALKEEFPQAGLQYSRDELASFLQQIEHYIKGERKILDLPVDIRATAFQQKVWQALRRIPYGETRSYSEIAADIGAPRAVRAVANACSQNSLALLIPCHRVIQKNGDPAGYRWGIERKKALLKREKKSSE